MGSFINSFRGQLGRDTAKVVSNWLWGDKHATPIRHIKGKAAYGTDKTVSSEEKRDKKETELLAVGHDIAEQEIRYKKSREARKEISSLARRSIPTSKDDLVNMIWELSVYIETNEWKSEHDDENEIENKLVDAAFNKFRQCLFCLESKYAGSTEIDLFKKKQNLYNRKRYFKKHGNLILTIIIFVACISLVVFISPMNNLFRKHLYGIL